MSSPLGAPLPRREDFRFLTGAGRYLDDIDIPRALHACFVRSPHAHAQIRAIDVTAARAVPGVVAVVTAAEVNQWTAPLRMAPPIEGLQPLEFATLPSDKVDSTATRWPVSSRPTAISPKTPRSWSGSITSRCLR
jgi:aerobic carbon-monoxide dehydrogenase large subunit